MTHVFHVTVDAAPNPSSNSSNETDDQPPIIGNHGTDSETSISTCTRPVTGRQVIAERIDLGHSVVIRSCADGCRHKPGLRDGTSSGRGRRTVTATPTLLQTMNRTAIYDLLNSASSDNLHWPWRPFGHRKTSQLFRSSACLHNRRIT